MTASLMSFASDSALLRFHFCSPIMLCRIVCVFHRLQALPQDDLGANPAIYHSLIHQVSDRLPSNQ